jgi:ABC-type transport system substrate-binding protein
VGQVGWAATRNQTVRHGGLVAFAAGLVMFAGAACTAPPPPPLVTSPVASTTAVVPTDSSQLVVGVDGIAGGYNPHQLADLSPATTMLSELLLPSVFRTAPDGTPELDQTLMVSAQVTKASPFTVTYVVRTDASWSDGTPVDAADFVYLRNQMSSQPGVVDAAGYQLISTIVARDNAKVIQVSFGQPYPAWRSLFDNLLPAHLLKDAPGGWAGALTDGFPASAGPFDIKNLDLGAAEIVLERSDRYWDKPSVLGQIILRKADTAGITAALHSGADQLAVTRVDATGVHLLDELAPDVRTTLVPRAELAAVLLRPDSPQLADQAVRSAVASAVDRNALIATGTGGGPDAALRADALVRAPTTAGYLATMPAGAPGASPNPSAAPGLLASAGYVRTNGVWSRNGSPLSLVIAAPAGDQPFVDIADQLRQQLVAAGIDATVTTPSAAQLYQQLLAPGGGAGGAAVDIVVGPQPVGGDATTELASWFGCQHSPSAASTSAPTGPLGMCDQSVQPTIDAALTGELSASAALAQVEPALWARAVEIPLFQFADQLAIGSQVTGIDAGPPMAGPFVGAAGWTRSTG